VATGQRIRHAWIGGAEEYSRTERVASSLNSANLERPSGPLRQPPRRIELGEARARVPAPLGRPILQAVGRAVAMVARSGDLAPEGRNGEGIIWRAAVTE
jgi:hypothetical protein